VSESRLRLRIAHGPWGTLAELEAVCADARTRGLGDAAEVLPPPPTTARTALVIVEPYIAGDGRGME
jgi:hypothetical protein